MGTYIRKLLLASLLAGGVGLHIAHAKSLTSRKLGLMDAQNYGKMWPKQKALMKRQQINAMKQKLFSFSSQAKRERIQDIQNRVEALEQMGGGENI